MRHPRTLRVVDDAAPRELLLDLLEHINETGWKYGWHSNGKKKYCHWNQKWGYSKRERQDVEERLPAPVEAVWRHLEAHYLNGMTLIGAYANAYTHSTEGYAHRDSKHPGDRTIVVYMNPEWDMDWGGETVFIKENGDTAACASVKFGRAVIFPSNWLHAARSVSRDCVMLRVVAVFKARVPDDADRSVEESAQGAQG